MHYHYFLRRYAGSEVINQIVQGKGTFLHADYEKATERFLEFARLRLFPPQSDTRSIADSERMFLDGEAAMFLNGSWEPQPVPKRGGEAGFCQQDWGVQLSPADGGQADLGRPCQRLHVRSGAFLRAGGRTPQGGAFAAQGDLFAGGAAPDRIRVLPASVHENFGGL